MNRKEFLKSLFVGLPFSSRPSIFRHTLSFDLYFYKKFYDKDFESSTFLEDTKTAFTIAREFMFSSDVENLSPLLTESCFFFYKQMAQQKFKKYNLRTVEVKDAKIHCIKISEQEGVKSYHISVEFEVVEACNDEETDLKLIWEFTKTDNDPQWKISLF